MLLFQCFLCSMITKTGEKNSQRISYNESLNMLWSLPTCNVAQVCPTGVLGVEILSTILDSTATEAKNHCPPTVSQIKFQEPYRGTIFQDGVL